MAQRAPVVLLPACNVLHDGSAHHSVGHEYTAAVRQVGVLPLIVPSAHREDIDALLAVADGVLLTGSPSNVHPAHYGHELHDPRLPLDPARDAWTLPLIPRAVELGLPLLAICRGMQELNVAYGGTLHQAVHEVAGYTDHRHDASLSPDRQYGAAHRVAVAADGVLAGIVEAESIEVNSLHGQGVDRLAAALEVEARAPDGLIEACSVRGAAALALGVQWHPEWNADWDAASRRLFQAFGVACAARVRRRQRRP